MGIYINGIGLISPQETRDNAQFLEQTIPLTNSYFPIAEPPYKEYIHPRELRRMSKVIRNGIVSGKIALANADLKMPDAILTGTGLGCVVDTEKFLLKMIENKEELLTPTSFIQSTHNTLGGAIAIGLGCHQYNMTYVHRGFSFETALLDAQLMMENNEINNCLLGGFDEMTDLHSKLLRTTNLFKSNGGAIPGQASGFFVLENEKKENSYAELLALEMIYRPANPAEKIKSVINDLLIKYGIDSEKLVVMMGYNGFDEETKVYNQIKGDLFSQNVITHFKHLCGEFYTASAFALWIASQMIKKQQIPDTILFSGHNPNPNIEYVLIYNQFQQKEHSLILLSK